MLPNVPQSLINLYSWITYLTPVWGLLVVIFWKPIRRIITKEKSRLITIESQLNSVQDDLTGHNDIFKALLQHELFQTARTALEHGYITEMELENLELLYNPYKALNGNGTAERLYKECCNLPHKKLDED